MIDILTAIIFVIFIMLGIKNGFLKSAYKTAAFLLSIILAYALYPYVKDLLGITAAADTIRSLTENAILTKIENTDGGITNFAGSLPEYMQSMISNGQISVQNAVTGFFTDLVMNVISFLLVFAAVRVIILIIGKIIDIISKLPIISFFDKGLGAVFGFMESLLVIYLIMAVIYVAEPLRQNSAVQQYVNNSTLTKLMFENNPIVKLITPTDYDSFTEVKF